MPQEDRPVSAIGCSVLAKKAGKEMGECSVLEGETRRANQARIRWEIGIKGGDGVG